MATIPDSALHDNNSPNLEEESRRKAAGEVEAAAAAPNNAAGNHGTIYAGFPLQLLHVRRDKNKTETTDVPVVKESMNHGDCFILCDGKSIYTWIGDQCSPFERSACALHAQSLARDHHGPVLEPDAKFWSSLGGEGPIRQAEVRVESVSGTKLIRPGELEFMLRQLGASFRPGEQVDVYDQMKKDWFAGVVEEITDANCEKDGLKIPEAAVKVTVAGGSGWKWVMPDDVCNSIRKKEKFHRDQKVEVVSPSICDSAWEAPTSQKLGSSGMSPMHVGAIIGGLKINALPAMKEDVSQIDFKPENEEPLSHKLCSFGMSSTRLCARMGAVKLKALREVKDEVQQVPELSPRDCEAEQGAEEAIAVLHPNLGRSRDNHFSYTELKGWVKHPAAADTDKDGYIAPNEMLGVEEATAVLHRNPGRSNDKHLSYTELKGWVQHPTAADTDKDGYIAPNEMLVNPCRATQKTSARLSRISG